MSGDVASLAGALAAVQKEITELESNIHAANSRAAELTQNISASSLQHAAIVELTAKATCDQNKARIELDDLQAVQACREEQAAKLQRLYTTSKVAAGD